MTHHSSISIARSIGISASLIGGMLVFAPAMIFLPNYLSKELAMLIYYVLAIGVPAGIWYRVYQTDVDPPFQSQVSVNAGTLALLALVTIALIMGVVTPLAELIPMPDSFRKILAETASQTNIFSFLTVVVAAPVLEELVFRGIILDGLLKRYSATTSILVSSVLFGIVHLNPWQFITALVIGVFAGWIYTRTQKLWLTIFIHFITNLTGFLIRFFVKSEELLKEVSLIEQVGGWLNLILLLAGSLFLAGMGIFFLKKHFDRYTVASETAIVL